MIHIFTTNCGSRLSTKGRQLRLRIDKSATMVCNFTTMVLDNLVVVVEMVLAI
jgi:hypothetical protein